MASGWRHDRFESLKSHAVLMTIKIESFMTMASFSLEISCEQNRGRIIGIIIKILTKSKGDT